MEFVTRNASIQPDRYTLINLDELTAYLAQVLGGQPEGGGIRGSMSRKGRYSRRSADGTQAATFGDPVLDSISSAAGALVIGGLTRAWILAMRQRPSYDYADLSDLVSKLNTSWLQVAPRA